jgi:hypothetical protein
MKTQAAVLSKLQIADTVHPCNGAAFLIAGHEITGMSLC